MTDTQGGAPRADPAWTTSAARPLTVTPDSASTSAWRADFVTAPPPVVPADESQATRLGLPRVFTPAEAALILQTLGLAEITECALRARAYRRQVPCHQNGRRIIFTLSDLHEIAEGQPRPPRPVAEPRITSSSPAPIMRRRPATPPQEAVQWRARNSRQARVRWKTT